MTFISYSYIILQVLYYFYIKYLYYNIFFYKICLLFLSCYCLSIFLKKEPIKLSSLKNKDFLKKFFMKTTFYHIYNITFILIFSLTYLNIFFFLRINSFNKEVNLKEYYFLIKRLIQQHTFAEFFINSFLVLLLLSLYLLLLIKIITYFKFHIIKRHLYSVSNIKYVLFILKLSHTLNFKTKIAIYFCDFIDNIYANYFFPYLKKKKNHNYSQLSLSNKYKEDLRFPPEPYVFAKKYKINSIACFLFYKGHYLILCFAIFFDITFNNYILYLFFKMLPFIFIYDIFIKVSLFLNQLHISSDEVINKYLYENIYYVNNNYAYFGEDLIDLKHFNKIYRKYVLNNFVCKDFDL